MAPHDKDQYDDVIDGALKQYGEVEPRAGLEGRVLARLAAVNQQSHLWNRWTWGIAVAISVCTVVVVLALMRPPHAQERPVAVQQPTVMNSKVAQDMRMPAPAKRRTTRARRHKQAELAEARRPSEFPSPHPLSEQERLLKSYVTTSPQEAALVANEQAERDKELAAMGWNTTVVPDSN